MISGTVDLAVTPPITIANVVTITAPLEVAPGDNVASVDLPVVQKIEPPTTRTWLPVIARE